MKRKILLASLLFAILMVVGAVSIYWGLLRSSSAGSAEDVIYARLRESGHFRHPTVTWEIHVQSVKGHVLQDPIFKRHAADGSGFDIIAYAQEAELKVDAVHKQVLIDMRRCNIIQQNGGTGYAESKIWPLDLPDGFFPE